MPASAKSFIPSSWEAELSTVYTRMVLMPSFLKLATSRVRLGMLMRGSAASAAPPGLDVDQYGGIVCGGDSGERTGRQHHGHKISHHQRRMHFPLL